MNGTQLLLTLVGVLFFWYVVFRVLKAILSKMVKKWPVVIWVTGIVTGFAFGIGYHWIAGVVSGLIILGILFKWQQSGTKKCSHCGSYDTKMIQSGVVEGRKFEEWVCNKCDRTIMYI